MVLRVGKPCPGQMLLEIGEAAGEWMPPGVDNLGIGQNQPDQADMGPIVRHLVDEGRAPGGSLHPCARQILFAQSCQPLRRQIGEDRQVTRARQVAGASAARPSSAKAMRQSDDVGKLLGPFDSGWSG